MHTAGGRRPKGIPLIRGRDFNDQDDQSSPGVVIINEAMARRYWPDRNPLQDSILVGRGVRPDYEKDPVRRVIAIVGNVRDIGLNRTPRPAISNRRPQTTLTSSQDLCAADFVAPS